MSISSRRPLVFALGLLALSGCAHDWIARSNENTNLLIAAEAPFDAEQAGHEGIPGFDEAISDNLPGHPARHRAALVQASAQLEERARSEADPQVLQDLAILQESAARRIRRIDLTQRLTVPFENVGRAVFFGVQSLLDPQVAASRRPAALVRLRKYTGLEPGTRPLTELVEAEIREALKEPGLLRPSRSEVQTAVERLPIFADSIEKLFAKYPMAHAEEALAALRRQLNSHLLFLQRELLPQALVDFRLPSELYAFRLETVGVDIPAAELTAMAHQGFDAIQKEMQPLAAAVAQARHLPSADYRDVIRALKKEQIPDDQVLAHYQGRLADLEAIIRERALVTLPKRPARIRIGTPGENAQQPAPHMVPARTVGNTGEQGEFVLPLSVPGAQEAKYDDFNYAAVSWTLTAHEARPGHELQFDRMVETGTSLARMLFAFNSVNVEGWGLYAESMVLPFMPDEGKLVSLQFRLMRAARAFLDPELQAGKITPEAANAFLQREVVLSPANARQEVDRYTFDSPGQATAYYYGYVRMKELRADVEKAQGAQFNARAFHDAVLAQGLLPPRLLRKALLGPAP